MIADIDLLFKESLRVYTSYIWFTFMLFNPHPLPPTHIPLLQHKRDNSFIPTDGVFVIPAIIYTFTFFHYNIFLSVERQINYTKCNTWTETIIYQSI